MKVVKPDLLHVTLKFLGQTDESKVEEISTRMRAATSGVHRFSIKLKGMGAFPSLSNIRVVWVGIENGDPLAKMAAALEQSMEELGFKAERRSFVPHLTLARARTSRNILNVQDILKSNAAAEFGEYMIDRIILKKSVLSPQGPTYSTVREQMLE